MRASLAFAVAVGALVLPALLAGGSAPTLAPGSWGPAPPRGAVPALSTCSGPMAPTPVNGTLSVAGQLGTPPSVAGVAVDVHYSYLLNYTPRGGPSSFTCVPRLIPFVTGGQGQFSVNLTIPTGGCGPSSCAAYQGPYAPVSFTLQNATPAGYEFQAGLSGAQATLRFIDALDLLETDPAGRETVSVAAPVVVVGHALAGDGTPTPAPVNWSWRLAGSGWALLSATNVSTLEVQASSGAGPATITVWANGSYGGRGTDLGPVGLVLSAAATAITATAVYPTQVDAGTPAEFSVNASGSGGYPYTATFAPGLGQAPVAALCSSGASSGGLVTLGCQARVTYNRSGSASPSVTVSNGFSSASAFLSPVDVSGALALAFVDPATASYPGRPVSLSVRVAEGTGTAPFGLACLTGGPSPWVCTAAPGGNATFALAFSVVGSYSLRATIQDAAGANASASTVLRVATAPQLDPLVPAPTNLTVGEPTVLTSALSGGAFPVAYWWNASAPNGTFASGSGVADGTWRTTFVPSAAGLVQVTLTAVDALGTRATALTRLLVTAGPATTIGGTPVPLELTAGVPLVIPWVALDSGLEAVPAFSSALSLQLLPDGGGPPGPAWVNVSGQSFAVGPDGTVTVPASDWTDGRLNVSLTVLRAGSGQLTVGDSALLPFDRPGPYALTVSADPYHLHLVDPVVEQAGARSNSTLWQVVDRFGNPEPSGFVVVRELFGGGEVDADSPLHFDGAAARVWVNYSVPGTGSGMVSVYSEWGESLLGPVQVGAVAPPDLSAAFLVVGAVAALGAAAVLVRRRQLQRRRRERAEGELERFARGRSAALAAVDSTARTLEEVRGRLQLGFVPEPEELSEWLQSLLAEGAVAAEPGPDGSPRYRASGVGEPEAPPRVEVDAAALEAALARGYEDDDGERPTRS